MITRCNTIVRSTSIGILPWVHGSHFGAMGAVDFQAYRKDCMIQWTHIFSFATRRFTLIGGPGK